MIAQISAQSYVFLRTCANVKELFLFFLTKHLVYQKRICIFAAKLVYFVKLL